jgi:hypothetical protein
MVAAYLGRPWIRERIRPLYDGIRPAYDRTAATGPMAEAELSAILALVEVLVPARYHPGPARARSIVQAATSTEPGLLMEYSAAAGYLDGLATRRFTSPFADLTSPQRDVLLARVLREYPAGPRGNRRNYFLARTEPLLIGSAASRLRALVVRDLLRRFFMEAQPLLIGYANVRGVPGDPRAYVTPPASPPASPTTGL